MAGAKRLASKSRELANTTTLSTWFVLTFESDHVWKMYKESQRHSFSSPGKGEFVAIKVDRIVVDWVLKPGLREFNSGVPSKSAPNHRMAHVKLLELRTLKLFLDHSIRAACFEPFSRASIANLFLQPFVGTFICHRLEVSPGNCFCALLLEAVLEPCTQNLLDPGNVRSCSCWGQNREDL